MRIYYITTEYPAGSSHTWGRHKVLAKTAVAAIVKVTKLVNDPREIIKEVRLIAESDQHA